MSTLLFSRSFSLPRGGASPRSRRPCGRCSSRTWCRRRAPRSDRRRSPTSRGRRRRACAASRSARPSSGVWSASSRRSVRGRSSVRSIGLPGLASSARSATTYDRAPSEAFTPRDLHRVLDDLLEEVRNRCGGDDRHRLRPRVYSHGRLMRQFQPVCPSGYVKNPCQHSASARVPGAAQRGHAEHRRRARNINDFRTVMAVAADRAADVRAAP